MKRECLLELCLGQKDRLSYSRRSERVNSRDRDEEMNRRDSEEPEQMLRTDG